MNTRFASVLCATLALVACKKSEKSGPVVAEVGDEKITAEEVRQRLNETSPFLRARYSTVERKKEFLENLVRNELLAQEAVRQGYDKSPAVRDQMKRAMIQELIKHQLDAKLSGTDIGDEELKNFGDKSGPVDTSAGVELVKLQVKTVAVNRTFEESKEPIRQRMARERRSRDYDEWVKGLRERTKVAIYDQELDKIQVDAAAQPPPAGPASISGGHPVPQAIAPAAPPAGQKAPSTA